MYTSSENLRRVRLAEPLGEGQRRKIALSAATAVRTDALHTVYTLSPDALSLSTELASVVRRRRRVEAGSMARSQHAPSTKLTTNHTIPSRRSLSGLCC